MVKFRTEWKKLINAGKRQKSARLDGQCFEPVQKLRTRLGP